jgi:hypothetical protein
MHAFNNPFCDLPLGYLAELEFCLRCGDVLPFVIVINGEFAWC